MLNQTQSDVRPVETPISEAPQPDLRAALFRLDFSAEEKDSAC